MSAISAKPRRYLTPMVLKTSYYNEIEQEINAIFWRMIFAPIKAVLVAQAFELFNAGDPLLDAINSGRVYYEGGRLYGKFDSKVSHQLKKLGGRFNKTTKSWDIPALPGDVQIAVAQANDRVTKTINSVIAVLDNTSIDKAIKSGNIPATYGKTVWKMNKDFIRASEQVAIAPKLTAKQMQIISQQWGENLDLYIRNWSEENILDLRKKITENTMRGQRAENLVKQIEETYGASRNKAKFLARQETSLLMSKFRETRYNEIGLDTYMWSGAMDARERPDHKALQGKIFSYKSPPVVDRKTGRTANPGEDFGCRCVAIPVVN